jgi:hypothetical protein
VPLIVRESSAGEGTLGVFLADEADAVPRGGIITVYGDRMEPSTAGSEGMYGLRDSKDPSMSRVGSPWMKPPGLVEASEPVGHMCNDAATISAPSQGWPSIAGLAKMVQDYDTESRARSNVQVTNDGTWRMVASREVMPGEELYLSLGAGHWLAQMLRTTREPLVRAVVYLYLAAAAPESLGGGSVKLDETGRLVMTTTGEEPTEDFAKSFVQRAIMLPEDKEVLDEYGLTADMTYKERLEKLAVMAAEGSGDDENGEAEMDEGDAEQAGEEDFDDLG